MRVLVKTDVGKARDLNEDSYYVPQEDDDLKLFIVADGMGGYNGGEIASSLAIKAAKNYIETNFISTPKDRESILELIKSSMQYANMVVYEKSKEDDELKGMGTTLEICFIYENKMYIGHIGDSRIYRIRKHIIRKLTNDHSYVETLVKDGKITKEEAKTHPKKNMLMKALGCTEYIEPDVFVRGFLKDDIVLMSSDGLTNMIDEQEIFNIITNNKENASEMLIQKANDNGGYDNITALIVYND